jgi:hypothetical protein
MARLEIAGHQVEVGDEFLKLSPEEQQHTVNDIASKIGGQAQQPQTGIGEAIMRGGAEGGGFGFEPKIAGLQAAGRQDPTQFTPGETDIGTLARGAYRYIKGDPEALKRYQQIRDEERARNELAAQQHPGLYNVSAVGGALANPTVFLGPGEAEAGLTTLKGLRALGQRSLANAAVGGGIGAVSGAGTAQGGVGDYLKQIGIGGALGAAGGGVLTPVTEAALGGGRAIWNRLSYPYRASTQTEDLASRALASAHQADVRSTHPDDIMSRAEFAANPNAVVGDLGAMATRDLARAAANISPEAANIMNRPINQRFEGQLGRGLDFFRSLMTHADPEAARAARETTAGGINNQNYQTALRAGDKPILTAEMQRMLASPDVQDAVKLANTQNTNDVLQNAAGARHFNVSFDENGRPTFQGGLPNLRYWDTVKKNLDDAAQNSSGNTARQIGKFAEDLRDSLDRSTIGPTGTSPYQKARQTAASFFGGKNAEEAADKFFEGEMSANQGRIGLAKMTPTEQALFKDRFIERYMKALSGNESMTANTDRANIMNKINASDTAREKLDVVLGKEDHKKLEAFVRGERLMDLIRPAVQGGSTTAKQQLAMLGVGAALGGGAGEYEGGGEWVTPGAAFGALMARSGRHLNIEADKKVMTAVAKMIASKDPAAIDRGYALLAKSNKMMNMLRHADTVMTRAVGTEAGTTRY